MPKSLTPWIVGIAVVIVISIGFGLLEGATGAQFGFEKLLLPLVFGGLAGYLAFNLSGNRKVAEADAQTRAKALEFAAPPGAAALYLYRTGFVGKAAGMNIEVSGRPVAQLKSPRFTRVEVAPGTHLVRAYFGGGAGAQSNAAEATVEAQAGGVIVLKCSLAMGALKNRVKIEAVTPDVARRELAGAKMVLAEAAEPGA